ncbi:hypothetical protein [Dyella monticola]|uniref:hypothetical protein n=1 Tax=Dyella monticola TaxID=1927958 RepID=UPI0011C026B1|nr:hypothetical protein [Dyella monticola]
MDQSVPTTPLHADARSQEPPFPHPALRPSLPWRYQPAAREYWSAWKRVDATDFTPAAARATHHAPARESVAPDASRAAPTALAQAAAAIATAQAAPSAIDVWRQVQSLLSGIEDMSPCKAEARYQDATELVQAALAIAPPDQRASLQASLINLDVLQAKRKKGGSRLLALRNMQVRHAAVLKQANPPLWEAWIHALRYWASIQAGQAALRKCDEAQAYCLQLQQFPHATLAAQRLLSGVLLQRADIEEGAAREQSLQRATELLHTLHENHPTAENALALAKATLAYGQVLPPEQARTAYGNALFLAFAAEHDPHLAHAGLQCRLAIQLAYEQIPDTPIQGEVAMDLTRRLEALPVNDADTLALMARAHLRAGNYADACRLCERAWRERQGSALLTLWQQACRLWAAASPGWHDTALQASERQYKRASCML